MGQTWDELDSLQLLIIQFIPGLAYNLLSVGQLLTKGYTVVFDHDKCIISDNKKNHVITIQRTRNNMFNVASIGRMIVAVVSQTTAELWHFYFRNLNYRSLHSMAQKRMAFGLPELKQDSHYEDCVLAKQLRNNFLVGEARRATSCLQLVHMDLCGSMSEDSLGANKYFYLLVDDYSR